MEPSGDGGDPAVNLVVERVRMTEALSRSEIMVLASPTRIEYYATDQWAGDLAELVRQKLKTEFGPAVEGQTDSGVSVTVLVVRAGGRSRRRRARGCKLQVTVRDPERSGTRATAREDLRSLATRLAADGRSGRRGVFECAERIAAEIAEDAVDPVSIEEVAGSIPGWLRILSVQHQSGRTGRNTGRKSV